MDALETLPFDVYGFEASPSPEHELPDAPVETPDPMLSLPTLKLGDENGDDVFEEPKVQNQTDQSIPPALLASHVAEGEQPRPAADASGNGGDGVDVPKATPEKPQGFNAMNHQARSLLILVYIINIWNLWNSVFSKPDM